MTGQMGEEYLLQESFNQTDPDTRLQWYCQPASWSVQLGQFVLHTDSNTDYWQRTHYGFKVDNGHFFFLPDVSGDFVLQTKVHLDYRSQYDQAGLMVRVGPNDWIKTSIEAEPNETANRMGAVVTQGGYSDWSTQPVGKDVDAFEVRIRREGDDFIIDARQAGEWLQLRMAHLVAAQGLPIAAGLYACSPKQGGFAARFDYLTIAKGRVAEGH